MSGPVRRRPGSASPIKLTAQVEEVRTAATKQPQSPVVTRTNVIETAAADAPVVAVEAARDAIVPPVPQVPEAKKPVTINLPVSLKKQAETAVLRTAADAGGYSSLTAFIEGAMQRELKRLSTEFNNGKPYTPNEGTFRQGRPIGS